MLLSVFLVIHVLLIIETALAYKSKRIFLDAFLIICLLLFPIVGYIGVRLINRESNRMGKVNVESDMPWLFEEKVLPPFRQLDNDLPFQYLIPLQEALLINNAQIRRRLLMDLIIKTPERYVGLLHLARLNDDVEVVHYATTILSELSKEYDERLHLLEKAYKASQITIDQYLDGLFTYINTGLAEGQYGRNLCERFIAIYDEKINSGNTMELLDYKRLSKVLFDLKSTNHIKLLVTKMEKDYPLEEETWMLKLQLAIEEHSSDDLSNLREQLRKIPVYFSSQNQKQLVFWGLK